MWTEFPSVSQIPSEAQWIVFCEERDLRLFIIMPRPESSYSDVS